MALLPFRPGCSPDLRALVRRCPSSGSRGRTPARQSALALRPVVPSGIAHPQPPVTLKSRRDPQSGRAASCAFVGLGSVVPLLQGRTAPSSASQLASVPRFRCDRKAPARLWRASRGAGSPVVRSSTPRGHEPCHASAMRGTLLPPWPKAPGFRVAYRAPAPRRHPWPDARTAPRS